MQYELVSANVSSQWAINNHMQQQQMHNSIVATSSLLVFARGNERGQLRWIRGEAQLQIYINKHTYTYNSVNT